MRLIDADALLQKFNDTGIQITFDLPVEEILGEDVDIDDFSMLVQDAIQAYKKMVIGTIKDMPTAYDVDKVVEQLKCESCDECLLLENCSANFGDGFMEKIREIVKAGGDTD